MSSNTPIFTIAKDLNVESNRILLACKKLGISAKGATKRLNKEELEKIKSYFATGKNVSDEVINLNKFKTCLLYTSPSPRDPKTSRMPSSA